jgi:hypothetical protein
MLVEIENGQTTRYEVFYPIFYLRSLDLRIYLNEIFKEGINSNQLI